MSQGFKYTSKLFTFERISPVLSIALVLLCLALSLYTSNVVAKSDIKGSKDLSFIERYPQSFIIDYSKADLINFIYPIKPNTQRKPKSLVSEEVLGSNTTVVYQVPSAVTNSPLKVFKSLEKSLLDGGFSKNISCSGAKTECGYFLYRQLLKGDIRKSHYKNVRGWKNFYENPYYLFSGKLTKQGKSYFIILTVSKYNDNVLATLDFLEEKPLELAKIAVNIESLTDTQQPQAIPDNSKKDIKQATDIPLVGRFPGSFITHSNHSDFIEITYPIKANNKGRNSSLLKDVAGTNITQVYEVPKSVTTSTLRVFKSFEKALTAAGFEQDISCSGEKSQCGNFFFRHFIKTDSRKSDYHGLKNWVNLNKGDYHLYTGQLEHEGKELYIILTVSRYREQLRYAIDLTESQPLEVAEIAISLESLTNDIESQGKAVLGGIYFDHNSTNLNAKSESSLKLIASYLKSKKDRRFLVVGHTDSDGSLAFNEGLSLGRSKSIISSLISNYGISNEQLIPYGIAFASPTANNKSDANKALNRRVELVVF